MTFNGTGLPSAERRMEKGFLLQKKYCNQIFICYIARYTPQLHYPRIRINSDGKE
jgi:hypothetical protein